jgi:hypothetical protein
MVISKIFDGIRVQNHERLGIERITRLFQDAVQKSGERFAQQALFNFEHK